MPNYTGYYYGYREYLKQAPGGAFPLFQDPEVASGIVLRPPVSSGNVFAQIVSNTGKKKLAGWLHFYDDLEIPYSYNVHIGDAPDAFTADYISWGYQTKYLFLNLYKYPVDLILQYRGSVILQRAFYDETQLIPLCAEGFKIKNLEAGRVAGYQLVAFR